MEQPKMGVNQPQTDKKNPKPASPQNGKDPSAGGDGKSSPNTYSSNEGEDEQNDNQNLDASQGNYSCEPDAQQR